MVYRRDQSPLLCNGVSIRTGDKVTYRFSAQSYSKSVDIINGSDHGGDSDTWTSLKLTEIIHPSGHRVIFTYDDAVISNYSAAKSRDHLSLFNGEVNRPVENWQNRRKCNSDEVMDLDSDGRSIILYRAFRKGHGVGI